MQAHSIKHKSIFWLSHDRVTQGRRDDFESGGARYQYRESGPLSSKKVGGPDYMFYPISTQKWGGPGPPGPYPYYAPVLWHVNKDLFISHKTSFDSQFQRLTLTGILWRPGSFPRHSYSVRPTLIQFMYIYLVVIIGNICSTRNTFHWNWKSIHLRSPAYGHHQMIIGLRSQAL